MSTQAGNENSVPAPLGYVRPGLQAFLVVAVALIILIAALRVRTCWNNDRYVEHTAGEWIALASDLKDGAFYRPLFGPSGYGGTRYFPLYFVLEAGLLELGVPVRLSGYLLSAAATVLLVAGAFSLMRRLGVERWLAACSAGAALAAAAVQWSLLSPHADGLACALNVWGLTVIARPRPNHRNVLLASILFSLAWSAKLTTVFGAGAAFLWLVLAGFSGMAWVLAVETACGWLAVLGTMAIASHGRILGILKACSSGGTSLALILSGPWHLLTLTVQEDPGLLLFLFLALLALFFLKSWRSLPVLFFVATLAATAVILGSPGTTSNHLLDVQVAAVILFTVWVAEEPAPLPKELGVCALALATLLAAVPLRFRLKVDDRMLPAHRFERVIALIGDTHKPILAENPALPVLAGQRPYVIDPWMLRLLQTRQPSFGEPLLEGLHSQAFSAVVLFMKDPRSEEGRVWYERAHFGPGFLQALNQSYRLESVVDGQFVYLPGTAPPQ
ncbi:MAG TPA: hypothetical protein VKM93_09665 [Terriglobia bacterium]|nr:hypothetical protein [Terriglobia bacterium]